MSKLHEMFWVDDPIPPKIREALKLCWDILDIIPNPKLRLESKRMLIQRFIEMWDAKIDELLELNRTLSMKDISLMFKEQLLDALTK